jgi:hypothetical protein
MVSLRLITSIQSTNNKQIPWLSMFNRYEIAGYLGLETGQSF